MKTLTELGVRFASGDERGVTRMGNVAERADHERLGALAVSGGPALSSLSLTSAAESSIEHLRASVDEATTMYQFGPRAAIGTVAIAASSLAAAIALVVVPHAGWQGGTIVAALIVALLLAPNAGVRPTLRLLDHAPWLLRSIAVGALLTTPIIATASDPGRLVGVFLVAAAFALMARTIVYTAIRACRRRGWFRDRTLVVGTGPAAHELVNVLGRRPEYGLEVLGSIGVASDGEPGAGLGRLADLPRLVKVLDVQRLVVGPCVPHDQLVALRSGIDSKVKLHFVPDPDGLAPAPKWHMIDLVDGVPVYTASPATPSGPTWAVKRAVDILGSGALLVLTAPVLLAVAIGVKLTSPGPVLFRQERVGRGGRLFTMLKFRTFPVDHEDKEFSLPHEACPTAFCRMLRRTSLDELPQLFNVLRGDMSLVGPRPERLPFVKTLTDAIPGYSDRHRVRGGLTGMAQVHGFWGNTSVQDRVRLDNLYIDEWSLWSDVVVLARTFAAVLRKSRA